MIADMADDNALRAHVLRRLTFGPRPGQVDDLADVAPADLIAQLLAADPFEPDPPSLGSDDDYSRLPQWWLDVMRDERAGVHERMVWFWHGHLTSGLEKASPSLMYRQHQLLRDHALGNFRDLVMAITIDAAMLYWLDGVGSSASAPNENYSRELMELFTLGRDGGYSEADVRAGATALAGWWVDGDHDDEVNYDEGSAATEPTDFLGRSVMYADDVVNAVCDHPSCAPFIATKLHTFIVGEPPSDDRRVELAAIFADGGLEIRPLLEAIVGHPSFLETRLNRPRSAVEWLIATSLLFDVEIDWWPLDGLGQVPFNPPNVAGWPGSGRWLSTGVEFGKAQVAYDNAWDTATLDSGDPLSDLLSRAGLYEISDTTRQVLEEAASSIESRRERSTMLHALITLSPEFSLA